MLEFISGAVAFILLLLGVLGFLSKRVRAMLSVPGKFVGGAQVLSIILIAIGIIAGGFVYAQGLWSTSTASVISPSGEVAGVSALSLAKCDYSSGTGVTGNQTVRADPNSNNKVYLDIARSASGFGGASVTNALYANVTFTCTREGAVDKAGSVLVVVKGDEFRSETSTTDSALYNILTTSSNPSSVWTGKYRQTVYAESGGVATSSDTQEYVYLTFAEGVKQATLGIFGTIDDTSFGNLNNYTIKDITISQRVGGSDSYLGTIAVNKLS